MPGVHALAQWLGPAASSTAIERRPHEGFTDARKPHYLGHRERLRRRYRDGGADAIPDYELLELVLLRAVPCRDTKPLAKSIVAQFGTFAEAMNAPEERLREVPGLGEAAITEIKLVRAAALRLMPGEVLERPVLASWSQVLDYCRALMGFVLVHNHPLPAIRHRPAPISR